MAEKKEAEQLRLGRTGERLARRFLERRGFELLARNLKLHTAEIDLLMRDGASFVLVEVKSARDRGGEETHPGRNYSREQKIRQRRAVHELERKFGDADFPFRHDLVEVLFGRFFSVKIRHYPDYYRNRNLTK